MASAFGWVVSRPAGDSWAPPGPGAPPPFKYAEARVLPPLAPFSPRPWFLAVDTVVLHHTATDSLAPVITHFNNPANKVSAHYTIARDGSVVQHVAPEFVAWHAGPSLDHLGRRRINQFSIGIELVNTGAQTYPTAQLASLNRLLKGLVEHYSIRFITSHQRIAQPPGRKNDPAGFPWQTVEGLGPRVIP